MLLKKRIDLHTSVKNGIAILLLGAVIIGSGGYIALNPPTFTTTENINSVTYSTAINHQSETVVNNSYLYDEDDILRNKDVYYNRLHPKLEVTPELSHEDADVDIDIEMFAVRNRDRNVIWENELPSDSETVSYNDRTLLIDIQEVEQLMDQSNLELPQGTVVKYRVIFNSEYTYVNQEVQQEARLILERDTPKTYRISTTKETETKSQTETNNKPVPSKTTEIYDHQLGKNGIIASSVGLIIFLLGIYLLYKARFDKRSDEVILYAYHLEKYRDWITFGRPFTDPQFMPKGEKNKVKVNTLKGLVQVSVDSDSRVIYSEELNTFYIFDDEHIYTFSPPNAKSPIDIDGSIPSVPEAESERETNFGFGEEDDFSSEIDDDESLTDNTFDGDSEDVDSKKSKDEMDNISDSDETDDEDKGPEESESGTRRDDDDESTGWRWG